MNRISKGMFALGIKNNIVDFVFAISITLAIVSVLRASDLISLRQEYNSISAEIDSLVWTLETKAIEKTHLPKVGGERVFPEGMEAQMIFWADDEARVWLNGYLVGETRLTPVEVTVPIFYFGIKNQIRVQCWDTDWVESGFMFGLYLRDTEGSLYPILVSDEKWRSGGIQSQEITYAHPVPDIPGAKAIWGSRVFGKVELTQTFDWSAMQSAALRAALPNRSSPDIQKHRMEYHDTLQHLALLEESRKKLKAMLLGQARGEPPVPFYSGAERRSLSLTLGEARPLQDQVPMLVIDQLQNWTRKLSPVSKRMVYPEPQRMKGELAANPALKHEILEGFITGERQLKYHPPGEGKAFSMMGLEAGRNGGMERANGDARARGWNRTRGTTRLGLWLPTFLVSFYVYYLIFRWKNLKRRETRYPWGI